MSEKDTTVLKDGQLAVAVVPMEGEIITGASTIETTAIVRTSAGDQLAVKAAIVGGGGGTSDYSDLANKPQINSVTLSGNKTATDLGLAKDDLSNLTVNAQVNIIPTLKGLYNMVSYTITGAPTISGGTVSGFSNSNYIQTTATCKMNEITEFVIKLKKSELQQGVQVVAALPGMYVFTYYRDVYMIIYKSDGAADIWSGQYLVADEYAWFKFVNDGTNIVIYRSNDGVTYTQSATREWAQYMQTTESPVIFGQFANSGQAAFTDGTIDLNETYIKVKDEYWFVGNSMNVNPAHLAMPSGVYDELTGPTESDTDIQYVAPADGYFFYGLRLSNGAATAISRYNIAINVLDENNDILYSSTMYNPCAEAYLVAFVPIEKGRKAVIRYYGTKSTNTSLNKLYFIYAVGSKSEYVPTVTP